MPGLRIALLVCGGLTGKAYDENGDYLDVYTRYLNATVPSTLDFQLDPFYVAHDPQLYPNEDEYDCIMLTGSAASAYEDIEWINTLVGFIARIASTKPHIKIIGICFGHQIIARALGGECVPNSGRWEVGPTAVRLTALGKKIFGEDSDELTIQQMHRDHVPTLPPHFHLLGSTDISPVQAMVRFAPSTDASSASAATSGLPLVQIITTQGHPEFTEPIVSAIVAQRNVGGAISHETKDEYEEKRRWVPDDGVGRIGKVLWEVMEGKL